ncbi:MAG: response regulator transcription factor [Christensenellaceae bacterium]|jgi:two-component system alkaline phosphatase synthesis response regulator PhoP|nr:response regulator transcription factor [Christensenellaceae bacterium]
MQRIVIVEDDEDIRELSLYALSAAGFETEGFETGQDFLKRFEKARDLPDLLLLDIMLPGEDGLALLKRLRAHARYGSMPVILLTAKGSEADKVKGLNLGADDYIAKPFGVTEMVARVQAVLRRTGAAAPKKKSKLGFERLTLDSERHSVSVEGLGPVPLTFLEFELLYYLLLNVEIVLSRDKLMAAVWGYDYEGESRTVDMHIKTLRQKLGPAGGYIKTVRNVGYKIGG